MDQTLLTIIGLLIAFGALLSPIVLAAGARDKAHAVNILAAEQRAANALVASERRLVEKIDREVGLINDRLTRVKDDYARRPEVEALENRFSTAIKEIKDEQRRAADKLDVRLVGMTESFESSFKEVKQLINSLQHIVIRTDQGPGE